jgi:ABC-type Mn2+/Zn2+ transport system permease subunit
MVARMHPRSEVIRPVLVAVVGQVGMLLLAAILVLSSTYGRLMKRLRSRKLRAISATVGAILAVVLLAGYRSFGLPPCDTLMLLVLIAYSLVR